MEKCRSQLPKCQVDAFKLFVLSDQQFKIQKYGIDSELKHRKAENPEFCHI